MGVSRPTGYKRRKPNGRNEGLDNLPLPDPKFHGKIGNTYHDWQADKALLMSQLRDSRSKDWALHRLTTMGEVCRAVMHETLSKT
ncbi:MAG: hypothetical protein ACC645_00030 [Pirellulales bacterium]